MAWHGIAWHAPCAFSAPCSCFSACQLQAQSTLLLCNLAPQAVSPVQDKLSERKSGVFALVAHPGGSATGLADSMNSTFGGGWTSYILRLVKRMLTGMLQSSADGAMPLLHCTLAQDVPPGALYGPSIKGVMGMMNNDYMKGPPRRIELEAVCTRPESRELLWRASEDACGSFFDR